MASYSKTIIAGNLGKAPETNYTQGGMAVCKFSVATTDKWQDKQSQEWKEKTEWHRVVVFGKSAENCQKYLDKGSQVLVDGQNQTTQYEKDGITRYSTEIKAKTVQFLGGKKQGQQPQNQGYQNQPNNQQGYQNQGGYQQQEQFGAGMNQQQVDGDVPF